MSVIFLHIRKVENMQTAFLEAGRRKLDKAVTKILNEIKPLFFSEADADSKRHKAGN